MQKGEVKEAPTLAEGDLVLMAIGTTVSVGKNRFNKGRVKLILVFFIVLIFMIATFLLTAA